MPLPTSFEKPVVAPSSSPFDVEIEVVYQPPGGVGTHTTRADVTLGWPAGLSYVANSLRPTPGATVGSDHVTWSNQTISDAAGSRFSLKLSCDGSGTGPHALGAQATDLVNGGTDVAEKEVSCP